VAQKDSKKSVAKKQKSTKKSVAKKGSKSELKKLVAKAEKRAAKSSKSATAEATALKKPAAKKRPAKKSSAVKKSPAVNKSPAVKNSAETRQATPVRTRRTPATASEVPSSTWNVIALRAHARAAGVVGYSRMKKDDLLAHLAVH